jgi:Tfp pilus assembly protein PilV
VTAGGRSADVVNQQGMDRVARRFARRAQELRSEERGSFLIETIVAAVLVAVIAVAMLSAFDGANQASGRTKMRSIAGSLAQSDQERMRSMPVSMLNNLRQSQSKLVNGVKYNVDSRADWLNDDSSTTDCSANGNAGDYMEITSTVSSPTQPALRPIVVKSIVTPAPGTLGVNQGSLGVTVVDRRGQGVEGLTVNIIGPINASDTTDANGCAFFGYEPVGNYDVQTSRAGWVDIMGRPYAKTTASIASQQVSTKSLSYDEAGSATVSFVTDASDWASATTTTARPGVSGTARRIRLTHNLMEPPYVRDGAAPLGSAKWGDGTDKASIVADSLFPFGDMTASPQLTSPYGVYAGDCDANNPNNQPAAPAGQGAQTVDQVQIEPGKATPATVKLPALNIHATNAQHIRIKATSAGCSGTWDFYASDLNTAGNLKFPGLPYGSYSVCGDDNNGPSNSRRFIVPTTVNNFYRAGTTPVDVPVPTTGLKGAPCP